jgi:hypothetical protein
VRTVEINLRKNGKFAGKPWPSEAVKAGLDFGLNAGEDASIDGWWFVHQWLCKWLLDKASDRAMHPEQADRWIARYVAIRGVK